jgi:pimeloyl-ACP methyl ester carboxylesterase
MARDVLFIHGGGDRGYEADEPLAIVNEIAAIPGEIILVGHSLGASMLLKHLSEHEALRRIRGVFLLATPFWPGDEDWQKGLKLREDSRGHCRRTFRSHAGDGRTSAQQRLDTRRA